MINFENKTFLKILNLLTAYEMDEPYIMGPEKVNDKWISVYSGDFPLKPNEERTKMIIESLKRDHHGDCIKAPCTCTRCFSEEIIFKAAWMTYELGKKPIDKSE